MEDRASRLLRAGVLFPLLIVAAAGLVGVTGRTWSQGAAAADPVTGLAVHTVLAGTAVAPAVRPLGLAVLAGSGALLLVRGRGRTVLAVLLALLAATAAALAIRASVDDRVTGWAVAGVVLATTCALVAVTVALRSPTWATANSQRFDRPRGPGTGGDRDAWAALDRGEDPTL
jgi:Tryptophan-associated transmembrane protein (Trp_oprn_chp)